MKVFFEETVKKHVNIRPVPEFDGKGTFDGIKAITYDGAEKDGKKTKAFAYIGYPKDLSKKVPAVVLVHGGGGVPYLKWVKKWNDAGYAAIAMSNTGYFPKEEFKEHTSEIITESETNNWFEYGLKSFREDGYVDAPDNDRMQNFDKPVCEQWMYHAVSQVILAGNILRQDERVDKSKIGICGISWGGVISSIALAVDSRFCFGIPIYGSAYLSSGLGFVSELFKIGNNASVWGAENFMDDLKTPVLWLCWNSDTAFSVESNSKSYVKTASQNDKTRLSVINNMQHSHEHGWIRNEAIFFADMACKGGKQFPYYNERNEIINPDKLEIISEKLYYITEQMTYSLKDGEKIPTQDQEWQIVEFDGKIPKNAKGYYFEICFKLEGEELISCSPYVAE